MAAEAKGERSALLDYAKEAVCEAYGTASHATVLQSPDGQVEVVDYEPLKLSTFRVLGAVQGTILAEPILFFEQLLITLIFAVVGALTYFLFDLKLFSDRHGDVSIRRWVNNQEERMRVFATIMTGLAAFLLSFYSSKSVSRWWHIRSQGVGALKAATAELELLVCQLVTREEQVLKAIRRYSRASLALIFLWRQKRLHETRQYLLDMDVLTEVEIDHLEKCNHNLHETIWAWQMGIVTTLHGEGKIQSDQLLNKLLEKCLKGRMAVQVIHTYIAVKIPMGYVHLLGLLVKMHNLILAVIMGILFGPALQNMQIIVCFQLFGRTLILPFLFNAILMINAELADPFNGGVGDFPQTVYVRALEKDIGALVSATENLPEWLANRIAIPTSSAGPKPVETAPNFEAGARATSQAPGSTGSSTPPLQPGVSPDSGSSPRAEP